MEILKGLAIILGISFTGEIVATRFNLVVPGSIIGLLLLFFAIKFKIVKEDDINSVASVLQDNMAFLFVPLVRSNSTFLL